jgi:hypothetical protein
MNSENNNEEMPVVLYTSPDGKVMVNAIVKDETLWMTQAGMAMLFEVDKSSISRHLKNIFLEGELIEEVVVAKIATTTRHGAMADKMQQKDVNYYNLDAIIAVGYRVNSRRATQFRIWATSVLREYIIKGFALDDNRLKKGGNPFGEDYFRELLDRIRSIRASERRIWQQITDIFAECSIDYDRNSPFTRDFYAMVQNKFHYAITGKTAAEIVFENADHTKANMGLTTWGGAPNGRILKSDVTVAKNYLTIPKIRQLERTVTGFFDYIEGLIERGNTFTMEAFARSVNAFLEFNQYKVLEGSGSVSRCAADRKAGLEYDEFNRTQKIVSDFDREVKRLLDGDKPDDKGKNK